MSCALHYLLTEELNGVDVNTIQNNNVTSVIGPFLINIDPILGKSGGGGSEKFEIFCKAFFFTGGAQLSLSPQTVKNEYEEKNIVTLTCTVDVSSGEVLPRPSTSLPFPS